MDRLRFVLGVLGLLTVLAVSVWKVGILLTVVVVVGTIVLGLRHERTHPVRH